MCLSKLDSTVKEKFKGKKFGWKVFIKNYDSDLCGIYKGIDAPRPLEKWIDEKDFNGGFNDAIRTPYGGSYPTGWHIFLSRREARHDRCEGEVVKKVYFKEPLAWGYDTGHAAVVVTRKIFISKDKT